MPEIERQRKSGALIFTPTTEERIIVDTKREVLEMKEELSDKIKEVDAYLKKVKELG